MLDFGGKVSYPPSVLELALLDVEDPVEREFRVRQQYICIAKQEVSARGFRTLYWAVQKRVPCTELFPENEMDVAQRLHLPIRDIVRFSWPPRYFAFAVELLDLDCAVIEDPVVEVSYFKGGGKADPVVRILLSEADELLAYSRRKLIPPFQKCLRK